MTNYEKAKEEGIKEIMQEFPSLMVVVDAGGDKDEVDLSDVLFDRLSSFAEKIKEGVKKDLGEKYVLKSRESSDSQTIKE